MPKKKKKEEPPPKEESEDEFDGPPPSQPNVRGEYVCRTVPVAVLCDFTGFDTPVTLGRMWVEWNLVEDGTSVRSL